ncbi:hypothetical protein KJ591_02350, partial [Patescibacteria group bacterium]|nr:hypothetical protein [Patescibacteria group bacterium]
PIIKSKKKVIKNQVLRTFFSATLYKVIAKIYYSNKIKKARIVVEKCITQGERAWFPAVGGKSEAEGEQRFPRRGNRLRQFEATIRAI